MPRQSTVLARRVHLCACGLLTTHRPHTVRIHIQAFRVQDEKTIFLFNFKTAFGASCAVLVVGVVMHQQVIVFAPPLTMPPTHPHLTLSLAGGGSSSGFALIFCGLDYFWDRWCMTPLTPDRTNAR